MPGVFTADDIRTHPFQAEEHILAHAIYNCEAHSRRARQSQTQDVLSAVIYLLLDPAMHNESHHCMSNLRSSKEGG